MATVAYSRWTMQNSNPGGSGPAVNVFHILHGTTRPAAGDWTAFANAFKTFYGAIALYGMGTYTIAQRVLYYPHTGGPAEIAPVNSQTQAMTGSTAVPTQLAAVISWRTLLAGPRYRGRSYIGPLSQGGCPSSFLAGAFTTALAGAGATLISSIASTAGAGNGLAVHSHAPSADEILTLITSCAVDSKADTQRRRN
jgi:hypothetical protein